MPPKRPTRNDVSPLYAKLGPPLSAALRHCKGNRERAEEMLAEWKSWRAEFGERWDAGEDVPPPPHSETLGAGFAKPR